MKIGITVIIIHYEQQRDLRRCIESIYSQSDPPEKILVIDDCSSVCPSVSSLPHHDGIPIEVWSEEENSGSPSKPRNTGVRLCTTSHLAFLDADDLWLPHTSENMRHAWENCPGAIVHGDIIAWKEDGTSVYLQQGLDNTRQINQKRSTFRRLLRGGNQIFLSTTGGPTRVFGDNLSDINQVWEDYDLWLRLAQQEHPFVHTGFIHTLYQVKERSRSRSRQYRHEGCSGIKDKHFKNLPAWRWPLWYWKQRFL